VAMMIPTWTMGNVMMMVQYATGHARLNDFNILQRHLWPGLEEQCLEHHSHLMVINHGHSAIGLLVLLLARSSNSQATTRFKITSYYF
jgi:hypothetical protein